MESRLKVVSVMLLAALVLSLVPAAMLPTPASAAACYHAQFVADVTVPDGATYDPGATFRKTWRLRNIGDCAWNGVSLVFDSGTQMGTTASVPISSSVLPGQTVEVSVDLTAPSTAGRYRGYWKLKGDPGPIIFGIGRNANNPFWVEINVKGAPTTSVVYDFAANAGSATWESSAGGLPSPGPDGDPRGYWLTGLDWKYEDGTSPKPAILVAPPQNITNGYVRGIYPAFRVQTGDIFKTQVGCELPATSCYVQFSLAYQIGTASPITIWRFNEKWDQRTRPSDKVYPDIKLDALAGKDVRFILFMSASGSPVGDRALWGNPVIVRKGGAPATTSTPSPTPTATGTAVTSTATATPTNTTVAPSATPTPTNTTVAPSATPTTTATTSASAYQNTKYAFRFTLPAGATVASQTDNSGRVNLPITAGTNLLEKYVQVNVEEGRNPCVSPAVEPNPTSSESVTINNIQFLKQTGQGAAAGNRYDWTAYSTIRNNACISLAFILHSANQGNYSPTPPAFDSAAESAVFSTVMSTFNWTT
jgi:hypothetical protein